MREIKIYCNGCHKDITAKKSYRISLQVMKQEPIKDSAMCLPYNGPIEQEELDLCKYCYEKLHKQLSETFLKGEE